VKEYILLTMDTLPEISMKTGIHVDALLKNLEFAEQNDSVYMFFRMAYNPSWTAVRVSKESATPELLEMLIEKEGGVDRYERRAEELEGQQRRRLEESGYQTDFFDNPNEQEVITFIEMFRKASKTYGKEE